MMVVVENNESHLSHILVFLHEFEDRANRNPGSSRDWKSIGTSADRRECDRFDLMLKGQSQAVSVRVSEKPVFIIRSTMPYRTDCMNHMPCLQLAATRNHGFSCQKFAPLLADPPALFKDLRSTSAMDRAINTSTPHKTRVCSIDNRIDFFKRNVTLLQHEHCLSYAGHFH